LKGAGRASRAQAEELYHLIDDTSTYKERFRSSWTRPASEKLYKAAEEAVKALATYFNLREVLEDARKSGGWSVGRLEKTALRVF
jgi:cytochrome c peroxidase